MNIPFLGKKLLFLRRIRFTPATALVWGILFLAILLISVLAWDGYLLAQSLSPLQTQSAPESKKISLTPGDIDDAIRILDARQQQFNSLLKGSAGTTTISF